MKVKKNQGNYISSIFALFLFVGCITYVIWKGQECIQKYLRKPETMDSVYKQIWDVPFPSVTFCAESNPSSYDKNALSKCKRTKNDYTFSKAIA